MITLAVLVLSAGLDFAGDSELAAPERKNAAPSATTRSVNRRQSGIMNKQVLEVGTARDGSAAAGARIRGKNITQEQNGLGNEQRMSLGRPRP